MSMPKRLAALVVIVALAAGACGSAAPATLTKVKFQLKWVAQTQFAGYYAALDQGYYKDAGLDVTLLLGGPQVDEVQAVASGVADMGTTWLPSMLRARENGASDLVSIAQIYQRSGTRMASFKTKSITKPADMAGKKIGSWLGGNEPELFAALTKAGIDPTDASKVNVIKQNFDMSGLLNGDLDAAQAMIYNEYAQVLEAKNPATGQLYQPSDLNVIDFNDPSVATAMLQDQVFAKSSWLATGNNAAVATKFLTASYKGWIYCRDNFQKCVDLVLAHGTQLGASHQAWELNEVNALIWPSPNGIGTLDPAAWDQTAQIATTYKVLKAAPPADAFRTDLAKAALAALGSVDAKGTSFVKQTVTLNADGK
ncbi:MAG: NitT/TauT family transport system substrate-binding protein [Chloroflexota bacterium]|jgi:NitT/TauT family transport system substrate-binding protein|nr:NitT/TauT family transport system substrate-binding protein [Chloroflexota bacterium]